MSVRGNRTRIIFAREDLKDVRFTRPQIKYLCEEAIRCVLLEPKRDSTHERENRCVLICLTTLSEPFCHLKGCRCALSGP